MKRILLSLLALCLTLSIQAEDWMARLADNTYVWKVSIPGTHDAATGHGFTGVLGTLAGSSTSKTQDKDLKGQWECGIRCFDLRPAVNGSSLDIFHGILQTKLGMKSAMQQLCTLLDEHPTEFCVVVMRHESDADDNNSTWGAKMRDLLNDETIGNHLVKFTSTCRVKDVRGKILLISRDKYDEGPKGAYAEGWTHEADINKQMGASLVNASGSRATLYVQDFFDSTDGKLDTKIASVLDLLEKTVAMRKKTTPVWCINYCSAYSKTTNIFGNKISSSDGYRDNAAKVHAAVLDYMTTQPLGGPMGMMIMDFAGVDKSGSYNVRSQELINAIIHSNFAETEAIAEAKAKLQKLYDEAVLANPDILSFVIQSRLKNACQSAETILGKSSPTYTELTNAIQTMNDLLPVIRTMDITELQTVFLEMQDYGYMDELAARALMNALSQDVINDALQGIVTRFKQHAQTRSEQPTISSRPSESVVGKDDNVAATYIDDRAQGYYLYNVGTGRWFCGGDEWGAHAAVGFPGIRITTPKDDYGTGHYNGIVTWLCNGDWGTNMKLNSGGFCDTGGNAWKFWLVDAEKGIYTISNNGNNQGVNESNGFGTKDLVGFVPTTLARVDVHQTDANDPNNQWIFVTQEQRDQMTQLAMADASPENPIDLTYKIQMPGFNQRERLEGENQNNERLPWVCNKERYTYDNEPYDYGNIGAHRHIIYERGANHADFCVDIYDWESFSLTQTLTGLTPGRYRVRVQGYYNQPERLAVLVANDSIQPLLYQREITMPSWVNGGEYADNTWQAIECFQNGLYWNEVECLVTADGTLTLGVQKAQHIDGDVLLFDNFRLEYIGPDTTDAISSVEDNTVGPSLYNLAGQRITKPIRGLFITNGKKIVARP